MTEHQPSTFEAWAGLQPTDWRSAVWSAASEVWGAHPSYLGLQQQLEALMRRATDQAEARLAFDFETLVSEYWDTALKVGSLMGFALARTWPADLEGLDSWIDHAAAYADIMNVPLTRYQLETRKRDLSPGEPPSTDTTPADWAKGLLADWQDQAEDDDEGQQVGE